MNEPTDRTETINQLLTEGYSRRAIAERMGVSEKTIRNLLAAESALVEDAGSAPGTAESAPSAPDDAPVDDVVAYADWLPPGPLRVLPAATTEGGLTVNPVSATKIWIRCTCGHAAWRTAHGRDEWECGCARGRCHGPVQVAGPDGTAQLVWAPYRIRPFPGLPAEP